MMDNLEDVTRLPDDFDGRVRLFPLPELVVFPHAMQPLHIFEPRYCEMLSESMASDRLIAMATLTGGIAALPDADPPIATTVCLGRVISHSELEDDRHNILLVGMRRAKVVREIDAGRSFRMAEIDIIEDVYPTLGTETRNHLKKELLDAFGKIIPVSANVQQSLHELMAGQMSLGPITDIISYTLPFEVEDKLQLLANPNVDERAGRLVELLQSGKVQLHSVSVEEQSVAQEAPQPKFPPPFSDN
ncbi:MAG: LON peptidase substrate-binding domain-containing protein [Planctomycetota bacterium]